MRVLHVIQEMRLGGAERIVLSLTAGARERGHEVAIAAAPGPLADEARAPLFDLPILGRRPWRVPSGVWALSRALRAFRPDIVHCHNPGMAVLAAVTTRRGKRVPGLVSVHGSTARDYPRVARLLRMSRLTSVACGPGVAEALRAEDFEVDETIRNAVPPAPPPADRAALMQEWGFPADRPLVVAVGRLAPSKGHDFVIRAVAHLEDVALVIVGEGPERERLEMEASRLQIADRVRLAGERSDARAVMAAADVVALGSSERSAEHEGLPLVVLEAQAAGTPVVVGDILGIREVVEDGKSGLIVPAEEGAMAEAIRRILRDTELSRSIAAGALAAAGRYTEEDMVERFLSLYERSVAR